MKDKGILLIKAVAIIGVLLHHVSNRRLDPQAREWIGALASCFSWCVLAFFAASGWLHALADERRQRTIVEFTTSRAARILVPFAALIVVYSLIWEILQWGRIIELRGVIADGFIEKLTASAWPTGEEVAEQLYFLPILFVVSVAAHLVWRVLGQSGIIILGASVFVVAILKYPTSASTGFSMGVLFWGLFAYVGGFILFRARANRVLSISCVAGLAFASAVAIGPTGIYRLVPLALLALAPFVRPSPLLALSALGEASGTIYAYHAPFMLQPAVIAVSKLPLWQLQIVGVLLATVATSFCCCLLHFYLKDTRWKIVLM